MTLVIPYVSDEFAMLVCDRRFTHPDGRLGDDDGNKVVIYNRCHCFAYTGLTGINGKPTDIWLADVLATLRIAPLRPAIIKVRTEATEAFRRMSLPATLKRHAFVGVGWCRLQPMNLKHPVMFLVSNFHGHDGMPLPEAEDEFSGWVNVLPPHRPFRWAGIGQPISGELVAAATRLLRWMAQRRMSANAVWKVTSSVISQTARHNPAVGHGLLGVCIPLASLTKPDFRMTAPLDGVARFDPSEVSFLDILARNPKFVLHGPTVVDSGLISHGLKIIQLDLDASGRDVVAEQYMRKP